MSGSRYAEGGFEARFEVRRTDGKRCDPAARYFVLDLGVDEYSARLDPHAGKALRTYADSVRAENPALAADLDRMLGGDWPLELAQHGDAK